MASGDRWKSYKTKRNVEEGWRRREEEGLQLRKAKREEISKRRNINVDVEDATVSLHDKAGQEGSKVPTIQEFINDLLSPQPSTALTSATFIRKLLAKENPPIAEVVESGVIPLFVQFLGRDHQCTLQFESCWVLTNVASGSSLHTKVVVDAGAVPSLIRLLHSPFVNVQEQAVWALGNIAGDNVQFREFVLENGILDPLLLIFKSSSASGVLMKHATWTLSNLCRGKNPPLKSEYAARCLPILSQLLYHDNLNVISDTCWSLSFLADGSNKRIQQVIDAGVVMRLVELLM
ncbi:importin subunit alpha-5-like [Dysidea avara]|uniref:importin subunit alpha-5-like n=1 Tax=Dysidea avara TaxID=196820 RepID=UPI00332E407D